MSFKSLDGKKTLDITMNSCSIRVFSAITGESIEPDFLEFIENIDEDWESKFTSEYINSDGDIVEVFDPEKEKYWTNVQNLSQILDELIDIINDKESFDEEKKKEIEEEKKKEIEEEKKKEIEEIKTMRENIRFLEKLITQADEKSLDKSKVNFVKGIFKEIYEKVSKYERKYLFLIVVTVCSDNMFVYNTWKVQVPIIENEIKYYKTLELSSIDFLELYLTKFIKLRDFKENRIKERLNSGNEEEEIFEPGNFEIVDDFMLIYQQTLNKNLNNLCLAMFNYFHEEYYDSKNQINQLYCSHDGFRHLKNLIQYEEPTEILSNKDMKSDKKKNKSIFNFLKIIFKKLVD